MNIQNRKTKTEEFIEAYTFISNIKENQKLFFNTQTNSYEISGKDFEKTNVGYCLNWVLSKNTVKWVGEVTSRKFNGETGETTVTHISNIKILAEEAEKEIDEEIKNINKKLSEEKHNNYSERILNIVFKINNIIKIQNSAQIGEKNLIQTYNNRKEKQEIEIKFQEIEEIVNSISLKKLQTQKLQEKSNYNIRRFLSGNQKKELSSKNVLTFNFSKIEKTEDFQSKNQRKKQETSTQIDSISEKIFNQSKNPVLEKMESNINKINDFFSKYKIQTSIRAESKETVLIFDQPPKTKHIIDLKSSNIKEDSICVEKIRKAIFVNRYYVSLIDPKSITHKKNGLIFKFIYPEMNFSLDITQTFLEDFLEKKAICYSNIKLVRQKINYIKSDFQIDYSKSNLKENKISLRSKTINDLCFSIPLLINPFQMESYLKKIQDLELTEENKNHLVENTKKEKKFQFKGSTIKISNTLLLEGITNGKFSIGKSSFFVTKNSDIFLVENAKLGSGGWNRIYQVYDFCKKQSFALIKTKPGAKWVKYEACIEEMQDGCETLKELNEKDCVDGIPYASKEVTLFVGKNMIRKGFMLMELGNCDLYQACAQKFFSKLSLKVKLILLKSLIVALCHAHNNDIGHGDLKPTNILLKKNEKEELVRLFIGDWSGASKRAKRGAHFIHTPNYMPNEVIKHTPPSMDGLKRGDVFALSLSFLEALNEGKTLDLEKDSLNSAFYPLFFDKHEQEKQHKIRENLKHIEENVLNVLLEGLSSNAPDINVFLENYEKALKLIE